MRRQFFKCLDKGLRACNVQLPAHYKEVISHSAKKSFQESINCTHGQAKKYHLKLAYLVYETFNYLKANGVDSANTDVALMMAVITPNSRIMSQFLRKSTMCALLVLRQSQMVEARVHFDFSA